MTKVKVRNKSLGYILPLTFQMGKGKITDYWSLSNYPQNLLINSYLVYEKFVYSNCIYLVYKKQVNNPIYKVFETKYLTGHKNFISQDEDTNDFNIYALRIENNFLDDYKLILQGKYSKISSEAKVQIIRFAQADKNDRIYQVLNKDPRLKKELEERIGCYIDDDADLSDIIDLNNETLKIEDFYDMEYC